MAVTRGVEWLIKLVLDREARERVEREAKDTAEQVGEGFENSTKKSTSTFSRLWSATLGGVGNQIKALAATLGGLFAVSKVVEFFRESVMGAAEAEAGLNRLDGTLRTIGTTLAANRAEIEAGAKAFQASTVFDDDAYIATVQSLIGITGKYRESLDAVQVVADLAAAKQMDLQSAALIVGKAMIGETGTLSRYGIVVEEGADAMELLREKFAGMAQNEVRTFAGQMQQLNNEWGNFKEAVGGAVIDATSGRTLLSGLTEQIRRLTSYVEENGDQWMAWADVVKAVFNTLAMPVRIAFNLGQAIGEALVLASAGLAQLGLKVEEFVKPWVDNTAEIAEEQRRAAGAQAGLNDAWEDSKDAINDMAAGWGRVIVNARGARQAVEEVVETTANMTEAGAGAGNGLAALLGTHVGARKFTMPGLSLEGPERKKASPGLSRAMEGMDAAVEEWRTRQEEMVADATRFAENMTDVWMASFEAIGSGAGVFASLRQAVGGTAKAVLSELVKGKAAYHMAEGIGKLATGIWPPNPAALLSAGKHFLAAAAFKAIPGIAGSVIGGTGGGGAASVAAGSGTNRYSASKEMQMRATGPEINLYLDGFDPTNPKHQAKVGAASREMQERYGSRINNKTAGART